MKVFLTGAGGMIGQAAVTRLLMEGHSVTALVRTPKDIAYGHPSLRWVLGDIRSTAMLEAQMRGSQYVVHLAARKADEADSREVNVQGTQNVLDAAKKNGVRGIVHVSTISTKFREKGVYAQTKQDADEVVATSPLPSVTLKLSVVYGDLSSGILGSMVRYTKLPFVPIVGPGRATSRPISASDVGLAIERVLSIPFSKKNVYELGGPDVYSLNGLAEIIGREVHEKNVRIAHMPIPLGLLIARAFSFLPKPPITVSNIIGMNEEVSVDPTEFFQQYDFYPRSLSKGISELKKKEGQQKSESYAIMQYVFFGRVVHDHYVHLFEKALIHYGLHLFQLDPWLARNRLLLGGFDAITKFTHPRGVFQRKLLIAAAIVESMPASSGILLPQERSVISMLGTFSRVALSSTLKYLVGIGLLFVPNTFSKNA